MAEMQTLDALAVDPDRLHLIDVRDAVDYAAAQVPDAVPVPLAELEDRAGDLPAGKTLVTICGKGGGRSAEGGEIPNRLGHRDPLWLKGGTNGCLARNT